MRHFAAVMNNAPKMSGNADGKLIGLVLSYPDGGK